MIKIKYFFIVITVVSNSLSFAQFSISDLLNPTNKFLYFHNEIMSKISPIVKSDNFHLDSLFTSNLEGYESKHSFIYNENNKLSEWLENPGSKLKFLYDDNNYLIAQISLGINNTKWDSLSRVNYFYIENKLSKTIYQRFINGTWNNKIRRFNEYDSNGNISASVLEDWVDSVWVNDVKQNWFYSSTNKLDSILFQIWSNDRWQNDAKTQYYFNDNEIDLDSLISKDFRNSSWVNVIKRESKYDINHNEIEQVDKIWEDNIWNNQTKFIYSYNNLNLIDEVFCQQWNYNKWVNGIGVMFFQNPISDELKAAFQTHSLITFYSEITSVDNNLNSSIDSYYLSQNYPNPFNPTTQINYSIPEKAHITIKVYDVLGNELSTLVNEEKAMGNYTLEFKASSYVSGVYFYRLQSNNYSDTKKLIVLR